MEPPKISTIPKEVAQYKKTNEAAEAIAAISAVTDLTLLDAALKAETAKGDKARATVVEAIETAIKAATPAQA